MHINNWPALSCFGYSRRATGRQSERRGQTRKKRSSALLHFVVVEICYDSRRFSPTSFSKLSHCMSTWLLGHTSRETGACTYCAFGLSSMVGRSAPPRSSTSVVASRAFVAFVSETTFLAFLLLFNSFLFRLLPSFLFTGKRHSASLNQVASLTDGLCVCFFGPRRPASTNNFQSLKWIDRMDERQSTLTLWKGKKSLVYLTSAAALSQQTKGRQTKNEKKQKINSK